MLADSSDIGRFMFGVGALIQYKETDKILILKRASRPADFNKNQWELLYGRKAQFEELTTTLSREIKEEIGFDNIKIKKILRTWHFFRGKKEADKEILGITFWCQTDQKEVVLSDEHTEYQWVTPSEALELISVEGIQNDIKMFIEHRKTLKSALSRPDGEMIVF